MTHAQLPALPSEVHVLAPHLPALASEIVAAIATEVDEYARPLAALGLEAGLAPETLVLLAEAIFAYVDELSAESAEGFAREQAERAGELERRRRALAELLVATPAPDAGALAAASDTAHWRLPATLVVGVWRE